MIKVKDLREMIDNMPDNAEIKFIDKSALSIIGEYILLGFGLTTGAIFALSIIKMIDFMFGFICK